MAFTPPLATFHLGEQADLLIVTESKTADLSLPAKALVSKAGSRGVWQVVQGKLHFTKVQTGIEDRSAITEIVSGLQNGAQVAVAPAADMAKFTDGMKVREK